LSSDQTVTHTESRYLKALYRRQVEERGRLTTTILADIFDVRPATVTETLQHLADKNLVRYRRYYGAELTDEGIALAQRELRKHRILEVLLVKLLDYDSEMACEEASNLDYYCSTFLVNAICRSYGHPGVCPCDKPIFRDKECYEEEG